MNIHNISPKARIPMKTTAVKVLLPYIVAFQKKYATSPSFREMRQAIGKQSLQTVRFYLDILEKEGYIKIGKHLHRSIKVLKIK